MNVRVALLIVIFAVAGLLATLGTADRWAERNVPAALQPDRWELSEEGQHVRGLAEERCGPLAEGAWVDWPAGWRQPLLRDAPREQLGCFVTEVAPVFGRPLSPVQPVP